MRHFLLINGAHPNRNHVSALRFLYLAKSLALLGNEVFLVTPAEVACRHDGGLVPDKMRQVRPPTEPQITEPAFQHYEQIGTGCIYHLAIDGNKDFAKVNSLFPVLSRRFFNLINWITGPSTDHHWVEKCCSTLSKLGVLSKIDLIWAGFSPIDCWTIGRRMSLEAKIPLVIDVKDSWAHYIPLSLSFIVASKFTGVAGQTANSHLQWGELPWLLNHRHRKVIYSGFSTSVLRKLVKRSGLARSEVVAICFGRVQCDDYRLLLDCMEHWAISKGQKILVKYWGNNQETLLKIFRDKVGPVSLEVGPFIDAKDLMVEAALADFSFYPRSQHGAIHHKATELLSSRRPILVWGSESEETIELADQCKIPFYSCADRHDVYVALDNILDGKLKQEQFGDERELVRLTWEAQGERLSEFFEDIIEESFPQ